MIKRIKKKEIEKQHPFLLDLREGQIYTIITGSFKIMAIKSNGDMIIKSLQ
jgi:hypothetical protein